MINRAEWTIATPNVAIRMCTRCKDAEMLIERKSPRTVSPILKEFQ